MKAYTKLEKRAKKESKWISRSNKGIRDLILLQQLSNCWRNLNEIKLERLQVTCIEILFSSFLCLRFAMPQTVLPRADSKVFTHLCSASVVSARNDVCVIQRQLTTDWCVDSEHNETSSIKQIISTRTATTTTAKGEQAVKLTTVIAAYWSEDRHTQVLLCHFLKAKCCVTAGFPYLTRMSEQQHYFVFLWFSAKPISLSGARAFFFLLSLSTSVYSFISLPPPSVP